MLAPRQVDAGTGPANRHFDRHIALARHDQAKRTEKGVGSQIVGEKPVTSGRHKISYRHRLRLRIHHRDRYPVATVAAETAQSLKPLHIGHLQVKRCRAKPVGLIGKRQRLFKTTRCNDLHFRIGAGQIMLGEIATEAVFERHQNIHDLPPMV